MSVDIDRIGLLLSVTIGDEFARKVKRKSTSSMLRRERSMGLRLVVFWRTSCGIECAVKAEEAGYCMVCMRMMNDG